jgi:hypothetical protein
MFYTPIGLSPGTSNKLFDRRKAAWCDLADRLREDADAELGRD